jgi:hypothetical protein
MTLNISSPAIPTIGQAELISSMAVAVVKCPCKTIIMGQMGLPIVCASCKRVWFISASLKIQVQEVLQDLSKEFSHA